MIYNVQYYRKKSQLMVSLSMIEMKDSISGEEIKAENHFTKGPKSQGFYCTSVENIRKSTLSNPDCAEIIRGMVVF